MQGCARCGGAFLVNPGHCQGWTGAKDNITFFLKYKYFFGISKLTPRAQDGQISQDFSKLEELNKFKMRKTFWWQVNEDHNYISKATTVPR